MAIVELNCALIVDSEHWTAEALRDDENGLWVESVHQCEAASAGHDLLEARPELIIVDANSNEASDRVELIRAARISMPPPVVIVVGSKPSGTLIAEMLMAGADAYLEKPITSEALVQTIVQEGSGLYICQRMARLLVGRITLKDALHHLRGTMNTEALLRTWGSRRAAAALLGVDRRCVQRMVEEFGGPPGRPMVEAPRSNSHLAPRTNAWKSEASMERTGLRERLPSDIRRRGKTRSG